MSFGSMAAMRALSKQVREQQAEVQKRLASRRKSAGERGEAEAASEAMGCPSCREHYGFGDACPRCDVALVGISFLDSASVPQVTPDERPALVGPRYCCETCSRRSDSAHACSACGGAASLDLHDPADRQLFEAQQAYLLDLRQRRWALIRPTLIAGGLVLLALVMSSAANSIGYGMRVGDTGLVTLLWAVPAAAAVLAVFWSRR